MPVDTIKIEGLRELQRTLKRLGDVDTVNAIKKLNRDAAQEAASKAQARVPVRSGKLRQSIRGSGQQAAGVVRAGTARVPYAGPVEFGGYPGDRPFVAEGRYIFPAIEEVRKELRTRYEKELARVLRKYQ